MSRCLTLSRLIDKFYHPGSIYTPVDIEKVAGDTENAEENEHGNGMVLVGLLLAAFVDHRALGYPLPLRVVEGLHVVPHIVIVKLEAIVKP